VSAVLLVLAACGPAQRNGTGDDGSGGGGDGSSCAQNLCSPDLHDVVDCNGNVVQACDASAGCANGACVDPCEAAAANTSSVGCDYYAVNPDSYLTANGGCFAAYVANTWSTPITIGVNYDGAALPIDGFARIPTGQGASITYAPLTGGVLPPNQVAILFLANKAPIFPLPGYEACPSGVTPAFSSADAAVHGTGLGHAFHITTSAPIVAYDIFPYGGGNSAVTSATLLLPTSAWDTSYVAVDAWEQAHRPTDGSDDGGNTSPPFLEIVAQHDDTHVTIVPSVAIVAGAGVAAAAAATSTVYTLSAGQVLQFTQNAELNGSPVTSDGPIGMWGGHTCMDIPYDKIACDAAHQQIPPIHAMGSRYAAIRYPNRFSGVEESPPWRIMGGADGTTLTYEPSQPPGAPSTLAFGQLVIFNAPGPFIVTSQDEDHPFYMSAHMTGCQAVNDGSDCRGDPEFVNVVPPDQYLAAYTFFTDPTYPETHLVFSRERDDNGQFQDVTLDCVGTVSGWTQVDAADHVEYAYVDLVTGNFEGVGTCNNGIHTASSAHKFGLVVWGWGSAATGLFSSTYVSYAYPAGQSIKPINHVVVQ
jgi:hypothetical protein